MHPAAQKGFTLIELMDVGAIVAVLTAIALRVCQGYAIRAHVAEGISLAASAKTVVGENAASGAPTLASLWTDMGPTGSAVTSVYTKKVASVAAENTLALVPQSGGRAIAKTAVPAETINWVCNTSATTLATRCRSLSAVKRQQITWMLPV